MKSINSKSFKQVTGNSSNNKRSVSPLLSNHQGVAQSSSNPKSAKKKPIINSPYQKAMKEFESYGKPQRKKISNYLQSDSNKFRIVTEPVDDRIMHFKNNNLFSSSLAMKNPKKIQTEIRQSTTQMRLNLRQQKSRSRDRMYSNVNNINRGQDGYKSGERSQKNRSRAKDLNFPSKCGNCQKLMEEMEYLQSKMKDIIKGKDLWKKGEITFDQVQDIFSNSSSPNRNHIEKRIPSLEKLRNSQGSQNYGQKTINLEYKYGDKILEEIKCHFSDLMAQIQSLAVIDYPKMLQMHILKYEPSYEDYIDAQQNQLKQLFGKLRMSIEGKTIDYDTYDSDTQNSYTKTIMRNLTSRLNASLRQNLELKICKAIYERSQEISDQSEEYLRKVIEDVIENYVDRNKFGEKDRNKEKRKQKEKVSSKR